MLDSLGRSFLEWAQETPAGVRRTPEGTAGGKAGAARGLAKTSLTNPDRYTLTEKGQIEADARWEQANG